MLVFKCSMPIMKSKKIIHFFQFSVSNIPIRLLLFIWWMRILNYLFYHFMKNSLLNLKWNFICNIFIIKVFTKNDFFILIFINYFLYFNIFKLLSCINRWCNIIRFFSDVILCFNIFY
jgi:hypothetical protein